MDFARETSLRPGRKTRYPLHQVAQTDRGRLEENSKGEGLRMSEFRAMKAAMNTTRANWKTMLAVRFFGIRITFPDDCLAARVTIAVWRGKEYFLSYKKLDPL